MHLFSYAQNFSPIMPSHGYLLPLPVGREDLELRWWLLMFENEFSHMSLLLYISTAF